MVPYKFVLPHLTLPYLHQFLVRQEPAKVTVVEIVIFSKN